MKIEVYDTTDSARCTALNHEFLRCEDAFRNFEAHSKFMVRQKQLGASFPDENHYIAYRTL